MFQYRTEGESIAGSIEGEMTIYEAESLWASLQPVITENRPMTLDLSQVSEIDTAGVQILMAVKKHSRSHSWTLSLTHHSEAVLQAMQTMDLIGYFNDPVVLPREVL